MSDETQKFTWQEMMYLSNGCLLPDGLYQRFLDAEYVHPGQPVGLITEKGRAAQRAVTHDHAATAHDATPSSTVSEVHPEWVDELELHLLRMLVPVHPMGVPLRLTFDRNVARSAAMSGLCKLTETGDCTVAVITLKGLEAVRDA